MIKKIKPIVSLKETNGNPFKIINAVTEALKKYSYSKKEIKLFKRSIYKILPDILEGNYLNLFVAIAKVANLK
ncbi:MAG TPA: hypothetical protein ENH06_01225 [bacterium]|nr:hypothetical protein [bacterium]